MISLKLHLDRPAKRLFTSSGGEIDAIELIRDDETLYASCGEAFITIVNLNTPKSQCDLSKSDWVTLNVGGKLFTTTRSTLTQREPDSMLGRMFALGDGDNGPVMAPSPRDEGGAFLIDRSPEYFEPILGWLRHGQLILDDQDGVGISRKSSMGVLEEAKFFGFQSLIDVLEEMLERQRDAASVDANFSPLTRREVVHAIITTPTNVELRFQGVNLCGADLSKLDLRHVNFKYAQLKGCNLSGANLSYSCLERADLSDCNLDNAVLFGVKMVCANLSNSSLRHINCEDPMNVRTNMEGVNLKGANLEGSQLAQVNLRVAKLKNAILCNCDLRGACLAGADLEDCDLSGSDLHEANLRGANLKGATFELMMTPLHMAQAIGR